MSKSLPDCLQEICCTVQCSSICADTATLPGISAPFNSPYFDPAGFSTTAKPAEIKRWREAELTHGRVSMLAALGFIIGEQLEDFPAFLNVDGNITGAQSDGRLCWPQSVACRKSQQ